MQIPKKSYLGEARGRLSQLLGGSEEPGRIITAISTLFDQLAVDERSNYIAIEQAFTASVPSGVIMAYPSDDPPDGWLTCDGSTITEGDYPGLYAVVGDTLPDLRGRVIVGHDTGQTEFDTIEETGGEKTVTLTSAEMPQHTHTQNSHTHTQAAHDHTQNSHSHIQDAHSHTIGSGDQFVTLGSSGSNNAGLNVAAGGTRFSNTNTATPTISTVQPNINNANPDINATTATNQNTGGGGAHNNLQPYMVLNYIIKI